MFVFEMCLLGGGERRKEGGKWGVSDDSRSVGRLWSPRFVDHPYIFPRDGERDRWKTHTHTNTTFIQETGNLHETPTNQPTQYTSGTRLSIHVIFLQLRFRGKQLDACPHHFSFLALRRRSSMPASLPTLHLPLQQLEHKMMQTVVASFFDH